MLDDERRALVEQHLRLVYKIMRIHQLIRDEDAVQKGFLWLCKAAEKYDASKGKFSTYAYHYIDYSAQTYKKECAKHRIININDFSNENDDIFDPYECFADEKCDKIIKTLNNFNHLLKNTDKLTQNILMLKKLGYNQTEIGKVINTDQPRVSMVLNKIKNNKEIINGIEW